LVSKNGPPFALSYPLLSLLLLYLPTFSLLLPPPSPFRVLAFPVGVPMRDCDCAFFTHLDRPTTPIDSRSA